MRYTNRSYRPTSRRPARRHYKAIYLTLIAIVIFIGIIKAYSRYFPSTTSVQPIPQSQSAIKHEQCLTASGDSQLKLLASYEKYGIDGYRMMLFMPIPETTAQAQQGAAQMANQLEIWNKCGVQPLVIMEPPSSMSLTNFENGEYNTALNEYFGTLYIELHEHGVTSIGTWVPFSEGNILPQENSATGPAQFVANVNIVTATIRNYFAPSEAQISILLNNQTYLTPKWGSASSNIQAFLPYVQGLNGVSSLGFEGFPWTPTVSGFLSPNTVMAIASTMKTKDIWVNTGTWSQVINPNNGPKVLYASNAQRQKQLSYVIEALQSMRNKGYTVSVNLFAQNNFQTGNISTANWQYTTAQQLAALESFAKKASSNHVSVMLFDADH